MRPYHIIGVLLIGCSLTRGQGTFGNLDFELANVSAYPPGSSLVPASDAFPFWTPSFGTNPLSAVEYDTYSLGGGDIALIDSFASRLLNVNPIDGFSAFLIGAGVGVPPNAPSVLSQTGVIPAGTQSLLVKIHLWNNASGPIVTLGGQTLSMTPLQVLPSYTLYGASIPSFAGQSATLSFAAPLPIGGSQSYMVLDDITFSSITVPEPITPALLVAGGLLFVFWSFGRKRCNG